MHRTETYKSRYTEKSIIGRGTFGSATLVEQIQSKEEFIAKKIILTTLTPQQQESAFQEATLLKELKHPNIVSYVESFKEDDVLIIIMEYCAHGDLGFQIKRKKAKKETIPEMLIVNWFFELAMAMKHIHQHRIIHRDIKASNVFITKDGTIKIGDFGISKVLDSTASFAKSFVGTPFYLSPEVCESKPYSYKSDIWALGCVIFELCALEHPFESTSFVVLIQKIVKNDVPNIPDSYSTLLNDVIHKMLTKDEQSRPNIQDLLNDSDAQTLFTKYLEARPDSLSATTTGPTITAAMVTSVKAQSLAATRSDQNKDNLPEEKAAQSEHRRVNSAIIRESSEKRESSQKLLSKQQSQQPYSNRNDMVQSRERQIQNNLLRELKENPFDQLTPSRSSKILSQKSGANQFVISTPISFSNKKLQLAETVFSNDVPPLKPSSKFLVTSQKQAEDLSSDCQSGFSERIQMYVSAGNVVKTRASTNSSIVKKQKQPEFIQIPANGIINLDFLKHEGSDSPAFSPFNMPKSAQGSTTSSSSSMSRNRDSKRTFAAAAIDLEPAELHELADFLPDLGISQQLTSTNYQDIPVSKRIEEPSKAPGSESSASSSSSQNAITQQNVQQQQQQQQNNSETQKTLRPESPSFKIHKVKANSLVSSSLRTLSCQEKTVSQEYPINQNNQEDEDIFNSVKPEEEIYNLSSLRTASKRVSIEESILASQILKDESKKLLFSQINKIKNPSLNKDASKESGSSNSITSSVKSKNPWQSTQLFTQSSEKDSTKGTTTTDKSSTNSITTSNPAMFSQKAVSTIKSNNQFAQMKTLQSEKSTQNSANESKNAQPVMQMDQIEAKILTMRSKCKLTLGQKFEKVYKIISESIKLNVPNYKMKQLLVEVVGKERINDCFEVEMLIYQENLEPIKKS